MKWLVVAAAVLGAGMWWRSHDHRARSAGQPPAAGPPRARVHAPVAAPRRPTRDAPVSAAVASPVEPAASATPSASSDGEAAAQRAHLQASFAAQPVDAAWARTAGQALRDDLGRFTDDDVRLDGVECRSSLCRAALTPVDADAARSFLETWLHQRTWTGPGFFAGDEATGGGASTMVVFLARPATELPYLE